MRERPWHRINCQCPECVEPPVEPTGRQVAFLALLLGLVALLMWLGR